MLGLKKVNNENVSWKHKHRMMHLSWIPVALTAWSQLFSFVAPAQIPLLPQSHTEGYKFDALLHLPGISPYFDAVGSGLDHTAPRSTLR